MIIGGGLTGTSLAYWLGKKDDGKTLLLEAGRLASEASGRNAGFLLMGTAENYAADVKARGRDQANYLWEFSRDNLRLLKEHFGETDCDMLFRGTVVGEPQASSVNELKESLELMREDGFECDYLDPSALKNKYGINGMAGGLFLPENGQVNPVKLVRSLAALSGAKIEENRRVLRIEEKGDTVKVHGEDFQVECKKVIVATNAFLPQLLDSTSNLIRPVRAQMLALNKGVRAPFPVYSHSGFFYFRQTDEEVILGGARHLHIDEEQGYDDLTTNHVQMDLEKYARDHIQGASNSFATKRWSGTMGFTKDHIPKISSRISSSKISWIGGFSGHGLGFSFNLAKHFVEQLGGATPDSAFVESFLDA